MATAPAYQQQEGYKAQVAALTSATVFPPVLQDGGAAPVTPLRYHHLGLVCRSPAESAAFYGRLGFAPSSAGGGGVTRLANVGGLQLHLLQADEVAREAEGKDNVLMDFPAVKYPGHTHASWSVPSVPACKGFLEALGLPLSGTRSTLALFVRDLDKTTLEFERNDGKDEPPAAFAAEHIGEGKPLDHVGIRIRAPYERHLDFYARHLCVARAGRY